MHLRRPGPPQNPPPPPPLLRAATSDSNLGPAAAAAAAWDPACGRHVFRATTTTEVAEEVPCTTGTSDPLLRHHNPRFVENVPVISSKASHVVDPYSGGGGERFAGEVSPPPPPPSSVIHSAAARAGAAAAAGPVDRQTARSSVIVQSFKSGKQDILST